MPTPWVVSNGQIITPAGTAGLPRHHDPRQGHRAEPEYQHAHRRRPADGRPQAVTVFNTQTGAVLQTYKPFGSTSGSSTGITYTPDGLHLLFSQDGGYGPAYVAIASVDPATGLLTD